MTAAPLIIGALCSGRGSNFTAIMEAITAGRIKARAALIITDNPGAGIVDRAAQEGWPLEIMAWRDFPDRDAFEVAVVRRFQALGVELVTLAGFERLIGSRLVNAFPQRIMNIHPALLPAFPGLGVWRAQIDYGIKIAGCTVHFVDEGMDSGPVIIQAAVPVLAEDTPASLAARILKEEHRIYPRAVQLFAEGRLKVRGRQVLVQAGAEGPEKRGFRSPALIWPPLADDDDSRLSL